MTGRRLYVISAIVCTLTIMASCSTSKNTSTSRLYQAVITRYNTYFNGYEAYKRGYKAQEKAVADNYIDMLVLFPISDEKARKAGANDYDIAIQKAKKCVKQHSITAKPKKKGNGSLSEKEKKFRDKNEYNPFLWHAWMLMADAQMQKGDFLEAAGTYSYICNLFFDQPSIVAEARIRTAQCYAEMGWNYETEEMFSRVSTDTIPPRLQAEYNARMASHLLKQERYDEVLEHLTNGMKRPNRSKTSRIRETYLLGQLYKAIGQYQEAYKTFQKVIRMNPPYLIEFNARIQQTETMVSSNSNKMLKKLHRMGKDPNNKNYLDQLYYAIGNTFLAHNDTANALRNYEIGVVKSTRNGAETGILLLTMANLYWEKTDYHNAGRCYSKAIGLIDQKNEQYNTVKLRSQVLEDLTIQNNNIVLQDSLQKLATLSREQIDTIIGNIIAQVFEQEAIEAEKTDENDKNANTVNDLMSVKNSNDWYFYNPQLVQNGKRSFIEHWGRRKSEDDWRRQNKTVLTAENGDTASVSVTTDSINRLQTESDSVETVETDIHKKEYYYQQIPFTDEQKRASNAILTDALLNTGIIYKDQLREYPSAEKSFNRIVNDYPDADEAATALYNLYLMYSLWGRHDMADSCRSSMKRMFPEDELTLTICDSNFIDNAKYGRHREDSLYAETYNAYKAGDMVLVRHNCKISADKYPLGYHRAKFLFLEAACLLNDGNSSEFLATMKLIVEKYPKNEISQIAGLIAQGLQEGRILQSTLLSSIWERKNNDNNLTDIPDSVKPSFSNDRYQTYLFVLAYPKDSVDENRLLFEVAKYNFTNFMVRNFDISFSEWEGIGIMTISEFLNYDEAYYYQQSIFSDKELAKKLEGIKSVIIAEGNLEILKEFYSFREYQEFYESNLLNIPDIDGSTLFEEGEDIKETEMQ